MRKKVTLLTFGNTKVLRRDIVQEIDVNESMQYVLETMQGYHHFAYLSIKKYEKHGIGELKARLRHTQLQLMSNQLPDQSLSVTRQRNICSFLKRKINKHVHFDQTTFEQSIKNYLHLSKCLALLSQTGYIRSYTLRKTGRLFIHWFDVWEKPQIDIIECGIRSAESDRNIDGYNTQHDNFMMQAYNALGVDINKTDSKLNPIGLWPLKDSAMHKGIGRGMVVNDTQTDGGYDPKGYNRPFRNMSNPTAMPDIIRDMKRKQWLAIALMILILNEKE